MAQLRKEVADKQKRAKRQQSDGKQKQTSGSKNKDRTRFSPDSDMHAVITIGDDSPPERGKPGTSRGAVGTNRDIGSPDKIRLPDEPYKSMDDAHRRVQDSDTLQKEEVHNPQSMHHSQSNVHHYPPAHPEPFGNELRHHPVAPPLPPQHNVSKDDHENHHGGHDRLHTGPGPNNEKLHQSSREKEHTPMRNERPSHMYHRPPPRDGSKPKTLPPLPLPPVEMDTETDSDHSTFR